MRGDARRPHRPRLAGALSRRAAGLSLLALAVLLVGAAVLAAVLRRQSDLGPARLADGYSGWPAFGDNNLPVYIEPGGPDRLTVKDEVLGWGWWVYPPAELRFSRPIEATGLRLVVGAGWPDNLLGPYNPEVLKANGLIFRVFAGNREVAVLGPLSLGEVRTIDAPVPASMDVRITAEPVSPDLPRPWAAVADAHFWRTPWLRLVQRLLPGRLARLVANPGARNDPVGPVPISGLELTNGPSRLVVACEGAARGTFGLYRSGRPVLTARLPFPGDMPDCRAEVDQIDVTFPGAGATATFRPAGARGFVYSLSTGAPVPGLWPLAGTVHLGGILEVLTDNSRPVQQRIRADGWERQFEVGAGRPVIFRNGDGEGLLIASPDPTDFPLEVITRRPDPDRFELRVGRQQRPVLAGPHEELDGITLWLEPIPPPEGLSPSRAVAGFLAASSPPPPPDWYELEFEPWYVYWLDIDQERLLEQLGLVRRYFGDLGRWFVTLDAGWYLSGEKPGNWEVDLEKFPGGLRGLGVELHRLGIPGVLYFSAPLLNDRAEPGNWLNLAGFVERFPELVIPLRQLEGYTTYIYDYANPALLSVLEQTLSAHVEDVGAVGIFLDGLMDGDREATLAWAGGLLGPVPRPVVPRQPILESVDRVLGSKRDRMIHGWALPGAGDVLLRRPTSNLFGDSYPAWNHPYPWGGLWEHLDYALMQRLILGEQPNMGSVRILPDKSGVDDAQFELAVRWLEAAILTDAQVSLSFDLNLVKDWGSRRLSQLRGHLLQVRPGRGRVEGGLWPLGDRVQWVWNFRGELTFLGVFGSRQGEGRDVYHVPLPAGGHAYYEPFTGRGGVAGETLTVPVDANRFRMFALRSGAGPVWADAAWEWAADNAVVLTGPAPDQPVRSAEIVLYLPGPTPTYSVELGSQLARVPAGVVRCRISAPVPGTRVSWTPAEAPPVPEAPLIRACRPVPPLEPAPAPAPATPDVPRGR